MLQQFEKLIGQYVKRGFIIDCIQSNSLNDLAHQNDHIYDVCERALDIIQFAKNTNDISRVLSDKAISVVLHACLTHDLGCRYDRFQHEIISYGLMYQLMEKHYSLEEFSLKDRQAIGLGILEHRSSRKEKPSTFLSEIVSVADTGKPDIQKYVKRAIQFRLSRMNPTTKEDIVQDSMKHIQEKFGVNGIHWKSYPDIGLKMYSQEWDKFKSHIEDEELLISLCEVQYDHLKGIIYGQER